MKIRALVLLIAVLGTTVLRAEDAPTTWWENGKPSPDTDDRKGKDGFGAELFLTTDTEFPAEWQKPEPPALDPATKVQRNVSILTMVIFASPGLDKTGAADVTCDITVKKPDGSPYAEQKNVVCWKGKYNAPGHNLQLAQGGLGISIDPGDPLGKYTVEVVVRDNIKKVTLPLRATFEATETDYEQWMTFYYKSKDPRAFGGYLEYIEKEGYLAKEESAQPTCAFIGVILHEHPDLIAKYFSDISKFPENEQKSVAFLLQLSNTDEGRAVSRKSGFKADADKPPLDIPGMQITGPGDLDMCWGYFLASGDTRAVGRVISAMEFSKYEGALDAYKTSKQTEDDKNKAWLEATWQSAMWSLESNAKQHPLVMKYMEQQLRGGKLNKDEALWVGVIMSKLKPDLYKLAPPPK